MKKTKLLTTLGALVLVLSLGACEESTSQDEDIGDSLESGLVEDDSEETNLGGETSEIDPPDEREEFTIWCPSEIKELTEKQVERYISQFEGTEDEFPYKLVVENVSEGNAVSNVLVDFTAAADIFFAQDALYRCAGQGVVSPVPDDYLSDVKTRNEPSSIEATTVNSTLYAYPSSYADGYFAYYDTSILTEDDMKNQETIIAKCSEAGKTVSFELSFGWYNAAYFFGTGCVSEWGTDDNGNFVDYNDTFNSCPDGYDALEGMAQLMGSGVWYDNSSADFAFNSKYSGNSAVVVSSILEEATVKQYLGDNYAVAPLWNVTIPASTRALYGQEEARTYHLGSFLNFDFIGVKTNDSEKESWGHAIANYLSSEECQLERYYSSGWGPSNLNAQENEDVLNDVTLSALYAQSEYATIQFYYPGSWWDNTTALGTNVQNSVSSSWNTDSLIVVDMDYILAQYDFVNATILTASNYAYAVVGNLEGCSWQTHPVAHGFGYPQYAFNSDNAKEGTYSFDTDGTVHGKWSTSIDVVSEGVTLTDGTEVGLIRIVDYGSWTGNYGYSELTSDSLGQEFEYDNNIALTPGTYNMVFDYTGSSPAITISAV